MKRYVLLALVLVVTCFLFTGCRRRDPNAGMTVPATQATRPTTEPTVPMTTEPTVPATTEAATRDETERPTDSLTEPTTHETTEPTARGLIQDPGMR